MADTVKETILKNLVTTLAALDGTGGYTTNFNGRVYRMGLEGFDAAALPFAVVGEPDEVYDEELSQAGLQRIPTFMTVSISIWNHGLADGTTKLSTDLSVILGEVIKAVLADRTRGGVAVMTSLISSTSIVDHASEPNGFLELSLRIHYRFLASDPTVAV